MILSSACQPWPSDRAANAAQERSSYTTSWDTIVAAWCYPSTASGYPERRYLGARSGECSNDVFCRTLADTVRTLFGVLSVRSAHIPLFLCYFSILVVRPTGLEPVTHSLEGCCSIQLS